MIEFRNISKNFGSNQALAEVNAKVATGTFHVLLGENGAGKSTLIRILGGLTQPDMGELLLRGAPVSPADATQARRLGIGMVHQHFSLQPSLTVVENFALLDDEGGPGIRRQAIAAQIRNLASRLGLEVDPFARVGELAYNQRQLLEILRLFFLRFDVLVLDEPTSLLSEEQARIVLQLLRMEANEGRTVVLVTHKLREVLEFADRITVLRRGRVVAETSRDEVDADQLATLMFGQALKSSERQRVWSAPDPMLRIEDLCAKDARGRSAVSEISLKVSRGEVLGIAGMAGAGQETLLQVLAGLTPPSSGAIHVERPISRVPAPLRVAFVPADRLGLATVPGFSVAENLTLREIRHRASQGRFRLDLEHLHRVAAGMLAWCGLPLSVLNDPIGSLSGGNVQRVVLARELNGEPDLVLIEEPTHGLDASAVGMVHDAILAEAERGAAVIVSSSDLDELLSLCDRVVVISEGRLVYEGIPGPSLDRRWAFAIAMTGARDTRAPLPVDPQGAPASRPLGVNR